MKKIIRKTEVYSLQKVNERIEYYTQKAILIKEEQATIINSKLLSFWTNYKSIHYPE